jgi:hypothetical protein
VQTDIMFIAIVVFVGLIAFLWRQQRTIDRLTDKLMARDYGEFKRHEQKVMTEEAPKRKPMSYYDDDSVDTDEVK